MKYPNAIAGQDIEGRLILDGKFVFYLMDSKGLPFPVICELLKERNCSFTSEPFIQAAIDSKNYTRATIVKKMEVY